jgi:hypothetical protein
MVTLKWRVSKRCSTHVAQKMFTDFLFINTVEEIINLKVYKLVARGDPYRNRMAICALDASVSV